jgi:hypothetical protein
VPDYIFQSLWKKGVRAGVQQMKPEEAIKWFRQAATAVSTASPAKMIDSAGNFELVSNLSMNSIGKMYTFSYRAKGEGTPQLPYYDRYPIIFPFNFYPEKKSFIGINFHYVAPIYRSKLMDALYGIINNTKFDKTTKLKLSYNILKGASQFRYFKPMVHQYLLSHVQSQFLYVKPPLWDMAVLLPLARFKGAQQSRVWVESATKF